MSEAIQNVLRAGDCFYAPKSAQGLVADLCFTFLQDTKEHVAVRVFAMTFLFIHSKTLPELKTNLSLS